MLHTRAIATKATRILHAVYYFPVSLTIFKTTKINGVCEFPTSEDMRFRTGAYPSFLKKIRKSRPQYSTIYIS